MINHCGISCPSDSDQLSETRLVGLGSSLNDDVEALFSVRHYLKSDC